MTLPAMLPVMSGTPGSTKWAGLEHSHHTEQVLQEEVKLDEACIDLLRQQKVV